ncbi:MAG: FlgD immunoglobulin-like domain containing protein [Candidatus Neomarinimicrobiota bacterium]
MRLIILTFVLFSKPFSQVDYNLQIQPIFDTNCTTCHNYAGSATLNLTSFSGLINGGVSGPSIIAGDHENSLLYQRLILPVGSAGSMPPNVPLSQSEIDLIAQWIDQGATLQLDEVNNIHPRDLNLQQNYPNPFNPETRIDYQIFSSGYTTLTIFNIKGENVKTIFKGTTSIGNYSIFWDGTDDFGKLLPSGHYFYQLKNNEIIDTKKMVFLK